MPDTLFVVMGAGASFDASSDYREHPETRPPLVAHLFDDRFYPILNRYPMAKNAAPDIRDAMQAQGDVVAVSLEEHLRTQYAESVDPLDQRRYLSIVLYLQHVLWSVSVPDHEPLGRFNPDICIRLVNRLLSCWSHVCFITLNYDLVLDRCLADLRPLASLRDFIRPDRWSLIKLHGSVTWKYRLHGTSVSDLDNPPENLANLIDRTEIFHEWSLGEEGLRRIRTNNSTEPGFPALAAPLGPDDELVCPPDHQEFVRERLASVDALDLLVIGYSAYDRAILNLIRESGKEIRSLFVIGGTPDIAQSVIHRIGDATGFDVNSPAVGLSGGFSDWARSGLPQYPEWVQGR